MSARDLAKARDLIARGDFAPAARILRALCAANPSDAVAYADLAQALWRGGHHAEAAQHAGRAAQLVPNSPSFHFLHGFCLNMAGRLDEGILAMQRALALDPSNPDLVCPLVEAYAAAMRFDDAVRLARASIERFPHLPTLYASLASALSQLGDEHGADSTLALASARFPADLVIASQHAISSCYREGVGRAEQLARHARAAELFSTGLDPSAQIKFDPHPDRTLRVGILSPDLRSHSVAYFARPLIHHLGPGFKVSVFFTSGDSDALTLKLRAAVTRAGGSWHDVPTLETLPLAQLIRAQKVDVLIELSGLTNNHRLPVMAARPAPLQISCIGYPATTGLHTINARFVDTLTDPPGEERWHTESLVRLDPCFLCYTPIDQPPPPLPGPAARGEPITFGSFNAVTKFSDRALGLWARVLHAVPGSRLVLKVGGCSRPGGADPLLARLRAAGIDPSRVTLLERTASQAEHLALYSRMDVALDTYPYHGTTTTCEALLMGVPVVSRVGDRHASRVGLSLLSAVGKPEWAATDDDALVSVATRLAADHALLAQLRASLRPTLLASPLCDAEAYGRRAAGAIRSLWKARCARPAIRPTP